MVVLVTGQPGLKRGENGARVLASLLGRAPMAFDLRDPLVELGEVEALPGSLRRHRVGERRRKLAGQVRSLTPGQPRPQDSQRGKHRTLGQLVIADAGALGHGRSYLVLLHV